MTDRELHAEVRALFGEATVRAALADRDSLTLLDGPAWDQLVAAYDALVVASPASRHSLCATWPEPTRRAMVLVLLDFAFLGDVAGVAVGGVRNG